MRLTFPRVLAFVLLAGACVGELLTATVEQDGSTVIEGGGLVGGLLSTFDMTGFDDLSVNIDQEMKNQGIEPGDVSSVRVTELTLSTPDGEDLAFLDSLSLSISSPGLDTIRFAHLEDFPEGVTRVSMELDDVDLTEYAVAESLTITTDASGELPEDDTTIDIHMALEIEGTPQGACKAAQEGAAAEE